MDGELPAFQTKYRESEKARCITMASLRGVLSQALPSGDVAGFLAEVAPECLMPGSVDKFKVDKIGDTFESYVAVLAYH